MPRSLTGVSGEQLDSGSVSGPSSYPTGGFNVGTKLGRVSNAIVQGDDASYDLQFESASTNNLVVTAHSVGTANEVAAGTDLSGVDVTYFADRL